MLPILHSKSRGGNLAREDKCGNGREGTTQPCPKYDSHQVKGASIKDTEIGWRDGDAQHGEIHGRLWDKAYDSVKGDSEKYGKLVASYEDVLRKVMQTDLGSRSNPIAQNNPYARRKQMKQFVDLGIKRVERWSATLARLGAAGDLISNVKDIIGKALENVPQAALPWAAVSMSLEVCIPML
jgi:N-terminal domain of NWD NACHT-NTPase